MPAILVSKIIPYGSSLAIELHSKIVEKYRHILGGLKEGEMRVVTYLYGVYNENGKIVKAYRKFYTAPLRKVMDFYGQHFYVVDMNTLVADGIPVGYILVQILFTLRVEKVHGATSIRLPIFPGEYLYFYSSDIPDHVRSRMVEYEIGPLLRSAKELDLVFFLSEVGLGNIADDLVEGLKRFNASDYEGAIKFFRKVVEGFRELLKRDELIASCLSDKRRELLTEFLSKTFSLLSNFGEHAGTQGSVDEAKFSKEIVLAVSRYIVSYLTREEVRKAISELKGVVTTQKEGTQWVSLL